MKRDLVWKENIANIDSSSALKTTASLSSRRSPLGLKEQITPRTFKNSSFRIKPKGKA
jgi:hypothetical protein